MRLKEINWKIWAPIILGLAYLLSRFINLTIIPIFVDEAIYTRWSQIILSDPSNNLFIPLSDGKQPLYMWAAAQFLRVFKDPLFAARTASVFAGLFGVWGTYLLAKEFFGKRIGIISAVLFIFCPFLFLYNRLAVVDGMMTTFYIFAVYFIYLLVKNIKLKDSFLLGVMLG
ncbi:MAG: ArnT family glycosyltransferase, partial [Candidatus Paceibacterales bacterium]